MSLEDNSPFTYNLNHECSYQLLSDEDASDDKYRKELLLVFGMDVFEEDVMVKNIEKIGKDLNLRNSEQFVTLCIKSASKYLSEDFNMGLIILFSFDCFHMTHVCLQDLNSIGEIDKTNYNLLLKYLE